MAAQWRVANLDTNETIGAASHMNAPSRLIAAILLIAVATPLRANDFPTVDRVLYVQDCMRINPGPSFEMTSKCSCALDNLAGEVKYDDYVTMTTVVNAVSIGGERGGELRDNETLKPHIKRYRDLQARAYKACFITPR
jgi:hypothetical protein